MSRRVFEAGEFGPVRELSEEEKLERDVRRRYAEYAKKDWVQKLLKANNTPFEQWLDEQVANELEEKKKSRKNEEEGRDEKKDDDLRDAAKKAFKGTDFKNIY